MLVSHGSLPRARTCLTAALAFVKPDVVRIALADKLWADRWDAHLRHIAVVNEKYAGKFVVEHGANSRAEVAATRWRLFDSIATEWIVNVDDDDGPLGPYPLDDLGPEIGMVHSDVLGVCRVPVGQWYPGDCIFRRSELITEPDNAHMFKGSYYAYRTKAWKSIRRYVDNETSFEEWKIVWHMIKMGWKDHHVPQILQFHGLRDFLAEAAAVKATGMNWARKRTELAIAWDKRKDSR